MKTKPDPFILKLNKARSTRLLNKCKDKLKVGLKYSALMDSEQAIMKKKDDYMAHYCKSLCLSAIGDYAEAFSEINICLDLYEDFEDALIERGNLYQGMEEYDKSILDYTKALDVSPKNQSALYNRGYVYLICGMFNEAAKDFSEIVKDHPYDADAYNNLGLAYYQKGDVAAGLACLHKSLDLNPLSDAKENLNIIGKEIYNKNKKKNKGTE